MDLSDDASNSYFLSQDLLAEKIYPDARKNEESKNDQSTYCSLIVFRVRAQENIVSREIELTVRNLPF